MSWISNEQAGLLGKPNQHFQTGLLNFLKSPEALALGQGLLAGAQPSLTHPVTFGGAFAQGLANIPKAQEAAMQRKRLDLQEQRLNLALGQEARRAKKAPSVKMKKKDKIIVNEFLKKYPQYAGESPEDILAVAHYLRTLPRSDRSRGKNDELVADLFKE